MCADKAKHQPSPKHTLDEVLKTLQDLVHNELAEEGAGAAKRTRRRTKSDRDSDAADSPETNADDTETHNPAESEPQATSTDFETQAQSRATDAAALASLESLLQEFSPESLSPTPQTEPDTEAESTPEPEAVEPPPSKRGGKKKKTAPPEQTTIHWDDVPVLNEVVALPRGASVGIDDAPLPPPEKAREIAVRVIAKLNIELRKAGNAPLDPVIIDRLEQVLREMLVAVQPKPDIH